MLKGDMYIKTQKTCIIHIAKGWKRQGRLNRAFKPHCVQFASINVSSSLAEHRFKTETTKRRDETRVPRREKEEGGKRMTGRRCNQSQMQSDELSPEMTTGHERPPSTFLYPSSFQASPLPIPTSTIPDVFPSCRTGSIDIWEWDSMYNIHLHLCRTEGDLKE